ncbi:MAG: hypothetical protein GX053_01425 [Tissierella sp.]|nr:hypothetical protein [Tissierella sp.]
MDILVSSNLERLLYHLSNGDDVLIEDKMKQLSEKGYYKINNLEIDDFYGNYSTENEVNEAIRKLYIENNYLIDTHTAVAYSVYEKYILETQDKTKTIISSTASPFKFGSAVASAIGLDIDDKDEFTILEDLAKSSHIEIPKSIRDLKNKQVRHNINCDKKDMKAVIQEFLKVGEIDD